MLEGGRVKVSSQDIVSVRILNTKRYNPSQKKRGLAYHT